MPTIQGVGPPAFSGEAHDDPVTWIERFRVAARANNWNDEQAIAQLQIYVHQTAGNVWRMEVHDREENARTLAERLALPVEERAGLRPPLAELQARAQPFQTLDEALQWIGETFEIKHQKDGLIRQFFKCKQNERDVATYGHEFVSLLVRSGMHRSLTKEAQVKQFLKCLDPLMKEFVSAKVQDEGIKGLSLVMAAAKRMEESRPRLFLTEWNSGARQPDYVAALMEQESVKEERSQEVASSASPEYLALLEMVKELRASEQMAEAGLGPRVQFKEPEPQPPATLSPEFEALISVVREVVGSQGSSSGKISGGPQGGANIGGSVAGAPAANNDPGVRQHGAASPGGAQDHDMKTLLQVVADLGAKVENLARRPAPVQPGPPAMGQWLPQQWAYPPVQGLYPGQQYSGRQAAAYQNPRNDRGSCARCKATDHIVRDCPLPDRRRCFNCDEIGHPSYNCQKPLREGGQAAGPMRCFNCNQVGHLARECVQPPARNVAALQPMSGYAYPPMGAGPGYQNQLPSPYRGGPGHQNQPPVQYQGGPGYPNQQQPQGQQPGNGQGM
jgi:hypothetical protein